MNYQQLETTLLKTINTIYPELKVSTVKVSHKKFMKTNTLFITLLTNLNNNHNLKLHNSLYNIEYELIPHLLQIGGEHYNIFLSNNYNIYRTILTIKDINNKQLL
jgi:hypothetical protein